MALNSTVVEESVTLKEPAKIEYKTQIIWSNVLFFILVHMNFLYAVYLSLVVATWKTAIFACFYAHLGGLGITAGSHRLWSHITYKAKWPLRFLLCCLTSITAQNIYDFARDHRVHHKFTETDADPHNIKRGFFFAHLGWLMCKKHPDVARKGKTISMEDILADPIVRFQKRFYTSLSIFFCFVLPTTIPVCCWNETVWNSFFIAGMGKYCYTMNIAALLNSAAHKYGIQPYDKNVGARENALLSFLSLGESWHNYHHVFPSDYSTSELGYLFNFAKLFIDFMALINQAYELKTVHPEMVKNRKLRTGDGTRQQSELKKTTAILQSSLQFTGFQKSNLVRKN